MEPMNWIEFSKTVGVPTVILLVFVGLFFKYIAVPVVQAHINAIKRMTDQVDNIMDTQRKQTDNQTQMNGLQQQQVSIMDSQRKATEEIRQESRGNCRYPAIKTDIHGA